MAKEDILIIGGGFSGLIAAVELSHHFNVTILEANDYFGGRAYSIALGDDVIESGAEFIHGDMPITFDLLKKAGIQFQKTEGEMYRSRQGALEKETFSIKGWDQLLTNMKDLEMDMTMTDFLEKYYSGDNYAALRRQAIAYTEGFDIADPSRVSVQALAKEWSKQEDQYRLPGGYSALTNYLLLQLKAKNVKLLLSHYVHQVDWNKGNISVLCSNGKKYSANKLLLTVPLSLLQANTAFNQIRFIPPLDGVGQAAKSLGYGSVIKIVIRFKKALWPADTGFIFSEEKIPTWWTRFPDTTPILTGWLGGPKAAELSSLPDEELLANAFGSLSSILNSNTEQLLSEIEYSLVFNWQQVETALGGYSYPVVFSDESKEKLRTPIDDTIYFAGEGIYTGRHPGTVEAALQSGLEAVERIVQ